MTSSTGLPIVMPSTERATIRPGRPRVPQPEGSCPDRAPPEDSATARAPPISLRPSRSCGPSRPAAPCRLCETTPRPPPAVGGRRATGTRKASKNGSCPTAGDFLGPSAVSRENQPKQRNATLPTCTCRQPSAAVRLNPSRRSGGVESIAGGSYATPDALS
jgi:hypothetical protein